MRFASFVLWYQQAAVAVAEETEVVGEGVVVYASPVAMDEGGDEQEQGALRLVEVGYHHFYYVVSVARCYYDLGTGLEHIKMMTVQIIQDILEGLYR